MLATGVADVILEERPKLAQTGGWKMGRACRLCPGTSDINSFCYCQSIIHFDAEISDRAFDLGVAKQKLDSPKIARAPVNQSSLRASERVCSKSLGHRQTPTRLDPFLTNAMRRSSIPNC